MAEHEGLIDRARSYQGVIFDLDGTLYSRKSLSMKMLLNCPAPLRKLIPFQKKRASFKGRDCGSYENLISAWSNTLQWDRQEFLDWYRKVFYPAFIRILEHSYAAFPWVHSFLDQYQGKKAVFSDYGQIDERLSALGINPELFDVRISAESAGCLKPSERGFRTVADCLGLKPEEILMVGDREDTDGEGARRTGMGFYLI